MSSFAILGAAFLFAGNTFLAAQEGSVAGNEGLNAEVSQELDQIEALQGKHPFVLEKDKDPFKPLVQKPTPIPTPTPFIQREGRISTYTPPVQVVVPPLKLFVQGICGNESERLVMVSFENELRVMKKDDEVNGKFKLVDILPDKVVVYSIKEQMRRTFPIGGGKE